jgi:hypothetical protein
MYSISRGCCSSSALAENACEIFLLILE